LPQFSKKLSMIWRGIYFTITIKDHDSTLIRDSCKLKMEKGNQVNFWSDIWPTSFCFVDSYSTPFRLSFLKAGHICQMRYWLEDVWHWNLNWIRSLRARENLMLHKLMCVLNLAVIY
jgi:hypothetical protein